MKNNIIDITEYLPRNSKMWIVFEGKGRAFLVIPRFLKKYFLDILEINKNTFGRIKVIIKQSNKPPDNFPVSNFIYIEKENILYKFLNQVILLEEKL